MAMFTGLGAAIRGSYRTSFVLFGTAVVLWIGAAVAELVQHAVEWELGMFAPDADIESLVESDAYTAAGLTKVAAISLVSWLVPRYLYQEPSAGGASPTADAYRSACISVAAGGVLPCKRNWRRVLRPDGALARGLAVFAVLSASPILIEQGLAALASGGGWLESYVAAVGGPQLAGLLGALALTVPSMALMPWAVGLIAGDRSMTLRKSVRAMRRRWLWATFLMFGCFLPVAIPHFALNFLAMGAPPAVSATLLVVDSLLVGFTAVVLGSVGWMIYRIRVLDPLT